MFAEYKFSKYNHVVYKDDNMYAYNALTGGFCKFDKETEQILKTTNLCDNENINNLSKLPQTIINGLKKGGFIINKNINEFALIKSRHLMSRYSASGNALSLTILPTLACNFRCPYCFEADRGYKNISMGDDVINAILDFIDEKLKEKGVLQIAWFGGEPLLKFDVIEKLQTGILKIVEKKNLTFSASIITNGYLLSKEISDKLVALKVDFAQITLDGAQEEHDKSRVLQNGKPTFNKIVDNILSANENLEISVRVNVTKNNIDSMNGLMDYLVDAGFSKSKKRSIYFAVVRDYDCSNGMISSDCFVIKDFATEQAMLNKIAYQKGLNVKFKIKPKVLSCGSLSIRSCVIEPNGDMQKCWETVGNKNSCIGNIFDKRLSVEHKNNLCEWYSWTGFDNGMCRECNILPLCMGGCPLHTLNDNITKNLSNYKCIEYKYNLSDILENIIIKYNADKGV